MRTSLPVKGLEDYVLRLVAHYLPDGATPQYPVRPLVQRALERVEHCFSRIHRKYYQENGQPVFDHLNSDHVATFLYLLGNTAWSETGDERLPTKLFYLNKIMNGLDLYFSVAMPEVFLLVHPVGTVLGKAQYGNYLVVYQNCSVGAVTDVYPSLGEGVVLYSRSSVLGDCKIGDNVIVAANAFVLNTQVPDHQIVVGQYPDHRLTPNSKSVVSSLFGKDQ